MTKHPPPTAAGPLISVGAGALCACVCVPETATHGARPSAGPVQVQRCRRCTMAPPAHQRRQPVSTCLACLSGWTLGLAWRDGGCCPSQNAASARLVTLSATVILSEYLLQVGKSEGDPTAPPTLGTLLPEVSLSLPQSHVRVHTLNSTMLHHLNSSIHKQHIPSNTATAPSNMSDKTLAPFAPASRNPRIRPNVWTIAILAASAFLIFGLYSLPDFLLDAADDFTAASWPSRDIVSGQLRYSGEPRRRSLVPIQ